MNETSITTFPVTPVTLSARPLFPAFHLLAFVSIVGSPFTMYDLTTGESVSTAQNVASTGSRPAAGTFEIGATTPSSGFTHPVAFALGAQTGLLLSDLNAIAAALRFPLAARGITV